jgi:dTDP-4-amino-4,6-dideoxygalactose transaminase
VLKEKARNSLVKYLNDNGIEARNGFYSSHYMKIYKKFKSKKINYYNSKNISSTIVTLPSSASLKDKEIEYICKIINNFKFSKFLK